MIVPNDPPTTPEWSLPKRCCCACGCAAEAHLLDPALWRNDARRGCGCCVASCAGCAHGLEQPGLWLGDQA